jgi:hypothetical protein
MTVTLTRTNNLSTCQSKKGSGCLSRALDPNNRSIFATSNERIIECHRRAPLLKYYSDPPYQASLATSQWYDITVNRVYYLQESV